MPVWLNFVGYQAVWLITAAGAGRGLWWPGVLASAAFVIGVTLRAPGRRADLQLALIAIICGLVLDGVLTASGALRYAAAAPGFPAPIWILTLWAAFAMTIRHSLRWLLPRPLLAALLGGIGGPMAYWGAARGFTAIEFLMPQVAVGLLATGWAIAILVLVRAGRRYSATTPLHGEGSI